MLKVYIAAPFARWSRAKRARTLLRDLGFVVDSSWIDDAERAGGRESDNPGLMQDALARNDADVSTSDVVLAMTWHGEGGEMFAEARLALLRGIPVLWVGERFIGSSFRAGSERFTEMLDAFARLEEMRQKYLANTLPAPPDDDEPAIGDVEGAS